MYQIPLETNFEGLQLLLMLIILLYNAFDVTDLQLEGLKQASLASIMFIDRLQAHLHGQIDPEKGQTTEPPLSFLFGW